MKRIGIYGGAYNPPHVGHLAAARYALEALQLDKLLLIPSCDSPHKPLPAFSPTPEQRLEMLRIALQDEPRIEVSDLEIARGGTSYTWQTMEQVSVMYPNAQKILFMGTDMFLSFMDWREPETILKHTALGVFYRGQKGEQDAILAQKQALENMGATVYLVENPVTDISSTQLRRMLTFACAEPFLPAEVAHYIYEHGLYGVNRDLRDLSMDQLEQAVISLLKPDRVRHVLGCRDEAVRLAKHWGADETDAARAGLLHDITKALDGPLQLTLCDQYGIILDKFSSQNPKTLHALTGSLVAKRIFGEKDTVVAAIASHTTGKADMNLLEKIIYVADYMEPNRDFPGVEKLRSLAYTDMDEALKLGLTMTLELLKKQGRDISPESREALDYLNRPKGDMLC